MYIGQKGCSLLIWKDELWTNEISEAISARNADDLDEDLDSFAALIEQKLNVIERKLDGVKQISSEIIRWILFFLFLGMCILFVAYMHGKWKWTKSMGHFV